MPTNFHEISGNEITLLQGVFGMNITDYAHNLGLPLAPGQAMLRP